MKVLGIYGSPRIGGNSHILMDEVLKGVKSAGADVETVLSSILVISGCRECGGCDNTGRCVVNDEMQQVYPKLREADVIILSSPVFFYGLPSQLKAIIDRGQAEWNRRRLTKDPEERKEYNGGRGYLLAVGATRGKNLFEGVKLTARYFFDALDMSFEGGFFYSKIEGRGDIRDHPGALEEAYKLGKRVADDSEP